jgi:hypothetical protein
MASVPAETHEASADPLVASREPGPSSDGPAAAPSDEETRLADGSGPLQAARSLDDIAARIAGRSGAASDPGDRWSDSVTPDPVAIEALEGGADHRVEPTE